MTSSSNSEKDEAVRLKMRQAVGYDDAKHNEQSARSNTQAHEFERDTSHQGQTDGAMVVDPDETKHSEQPQPAKKKTLTIKWDAESMEQADRALTEMTKLDLGCVTWTAGKTMTLRFQGRSWGARRLAYMMFYCISEMPTYTRLRATCGNDRCTRPEHMKTY